MNALSDLMPGYGLIIHEWRTHGMCTGLSQETYFATLRKAYESVEIPADFPRDDAGRVKPSDIEAAFLAANPGMPADGVSIDCDRKYLREVRICMTKDMRFRPCPGTRTRKLPCLQRPDAAFIGLPVELLERLAQIIRVAPAWPSH